MPATLHKAKWVGPYATQLGPQTTLQPGDEWEVTEDDLKSAHWQAVGAAAIKVEKQALQTDAPAEVEQPAPDDAEGGD